MNVTSKEQKAIQEEARRKKITVSGLLRELIADNSSLLDRQHNYNNDYNAIDNAIDKELREAFNGF
jgi:hypothetical protein